MTKIPISEYLQKCIYTCSTSTTQETQSKIEMAVALGLCNFTSLIPTPSTTSSPTLLSFSKLINNNKKAYSSITTKNFQSFRVLYRYSAIEKDDEDEDEICSFNEAVALFNERAYYKCHDCLESLWYTAEEPTRTLLHGILQCAVGFYHLFNRVGLAINQKLIKLFWLGSFFFFFFLTLL